MSTGMKKNGRPPKLYVCKDCGKEMKTIDVRRHGLKCEGVKNGK